MDNSKKAVSMRRLLVVLLGYLAALIFVLSFLTASKIHIAFGLPNPLSETVTLMIAALMAIPVFLPFIWERITKVKFAGVEIDLSEVTVKVGATDELKDTERLAMASSLIPEITKKLALATAIKEAESSSVVEVDIGNGKSWLLTRLFLLAALAEEYTGIKRFMFLEEREGVMRSFVGMATPRTTRLSLAKTNPSLEKFYQQAVVDAKLRGDAGKLDSPDEWIEIAQQYASKFEDEARNDKWVTKDFLSSQDVEQGIRWDGGHVPVTLLYTIVDKPGPFVPLIKRNGQLAIVVDRQILAEQIAKNCLSG